MVKKTSKIGQRSLRMTPNDDSDISSSNETKSPDKEPEFREK